MKKRTITLAIIAFIILTILIIRCSYIYEKREYINIKSKLNAQDIGYVSWAYMFEYANPGDMITDKEEIELFLDYLDETNFEQFEFRSEIEHFISPDNNIIYVRVYIKDKGYADFYLSTDEIGKSYFWDREYGIHSLFYKQHKIKINNCDELYNYIYNKRNINNG